MKRKLALTVITFVFICTLLTAAAFASEYEQDGIKFIYDPQTHSGRFEGEGAISQVNGDTPWMAVADEVKQVTVGRGVTLYDDCLLNEFTGLENAYVEEGHPLYSSVDGVLFSADGKTLLSYPDGREGIAVVPDGTETLHARAFQKCNLITAIRFPESVKDVRLPFSGKSLKRIIFPADKAKMYAAAMNGIVKEAEMYGTADEIPDGTFENMDYITYVKLPEGLKRIGDKAFYFCKSLKSIEIPDTVTEIGQSAFAITGLEDIILPPGLEKIGAGAFCYTAVVNVRIPDAVTEIGSDAFTSRTLERLHIGAGVSDFDWVSVYSMDPGIEITVSPLNETLYSDAQGAIYNGNTRTLEYLPADFDGEYVMPDDVENVADDAFYFAKEMTAVHIGKSARDLSGLIGMAEHGYALKTLTLSGENENYVMESGALYDRGKTKLLMLSPGFEGMFRVPESVTAIGDYAFCGCTGISSVIMPEGLTSVGRRAFAYCNQSFEMTLPDCVTLERYSFDVFAPSLVYFYGTEARWKEVTAGDYWNENGLWAIQQTKALFNCVPPTAERPFSDVLRGKFYEQAVAWAIAEGVTNGKTDLGFAPDDKCTRAQVVTFIWRAAGSPEPMYRSCPFTDVREGAYYYKAMLWAVENGITDGMTPTSFAPSLKCTRAQVVTFLWRTCGKPSHSDECAFRDVDKTSFYYEAMLWAAENGITNGVSRTKFKPYDYCTRAQVVTFLYRNEKRDEV